MLFPVAQGGRGFEEHPRVPELTGQIASSEAPRASVLRNRHFGIRELTGNWHEPHSGSVDDADPARLSPFIRAYIGIDGHYSFHVHDLGGTHRPLRDPDAGDDE
ncbi:hypothetical protein ACFU44_17405 [Nocardia rhizosphaerihabitans]|uniref:hypothetical protein n=1 Tax=Nocardia rhizosphaerihabitans TaxID=1691570 RepID=UPI00366B49BC